MKRGVLVRYCLYFSHSFQPQSIVAISYFTYIQLNFAAQHRFVISFAPQELPRSYLKPSQTANLTASLLKSALQAYSSPCKQRVFQEGCHGTHEFLKQAFGTHEIQQFVSPLNFKRYNLLAPMFSNSKSGISCQSIQVMYCKFR